MRQDMPSIPDSQLKLRISLRVSFAMYSYGIYSQILHSKAEKFAVHNPQMAMSCHACLN